MNFQKKLQKNFQLATFFIETIRRFASHVNRLLENYKAKAHYVKFLKKHVQFEKLRTFNFSLAVIDFLRPSKENHLDPLRFLRFHNRKEVFILARYSGFERLNTKDFLPEKPSNFSHEFLEFFDTS